MTNAMTLTDELLIRYVDGLLDEKAASAVEAALTHDRVAAERVRLMQLSGAALRMEAARPFDAGEADALATRYLPTKSPAATVTASRRVGGGGARWQALAAGLLLAIGLAAGVAGGIGLSMRQQASAHPVWVMRVVDYHTLYARSTVEGSTVAVADIPALEARFKAAIGKAVTIPRYEADAMEFRRGQLLAFEGEPIIQLAYLPKAGAPMALCLKRGAGADTEPQLERVHDIGMVRWRQAGLDYVLVGHEGSEAMLGYARRAIEQISAART